jgi:hypothetical protein
MKQDVKQRNQCTFQWRECFHLTTSSQIILYSSSLVSVLLLHLLAPASPNGSALTTSAPTEDQVARAKALAEDLLVVLRIEYGKARGDTGGGYQGGYQQQAYGQQQAADPYAGYYVS